MSKFFHFRVELISTRVRFKGQQTGSPKLSSLNARAENKPGISIPVQLGKMSFVNSFLPKFSNL